MRVPSELKGIMVALYTPWTSDQKDIDAVALDQHINRLIDAGVHGLVPGGSTGEFTTMTNAERKELIEICVRSAAGRVPVVAGTGALSSSDCIELAVHAREAGASALMVVPPFYDVPSYGQLCALLAEIHEASGLDIMYYNIPSATGQNLTPEQLGGLGKFGVKYMKDTSGNAPALTELLFERQSEITTFNGWDTLTFYGLAAGAKGSVWGATNVIPDLSVQLWNAVAVEGDLKKGRELWSRIFPVCKYLESYNYAAAIKTGMELQGITTGGIRKPFGLLSKEETANFAPLLQNAGLRVGISNE
ncbi:aldolase [Polychaeton citri CBS 116435]|uniref:Aldolase n=1 Tax=Polychaeton citri CBS 116435 TaxID=1314669 RepID=A0A9P4Q042_9PEZI|nr:aldolase [Polychaeton citri CBS 116435]